MKQASRLVAALFGSCLILSALPSWAETGPADESSGAFCRPAAARLFAENLGRLLVLGSELNLSGDQRTKLAATVRSRGDEIRPIATSIIEKKKALREAVFNEDEKAINNSAENLGHAIGRAAVVVSKIISEAKGILTREQVERIQDFRSKSDRAEAAWLDQIGK